MNPNRNGRIVKKRSRGMPASVKNEKTRLKALELKIV